jgi:hypothetical protein
MTHQGDDADTEFLMQHDADIQSLRDAHSNHNRPEIERLQEKLIAAGVFVDYGPSGVMVGVAA